MTSCFIPCDYIPNRSYSLVRARELMVDLIAGGDIRILEGSVFGEWSKTPNFRDNLFILLVTGIYSAK
jgi:hypothetical protein